MNNRTRVYVLEDRNRFTLGVFTSIDNAVKAREYWCKMDTEMGKKDTVEDYSITPFWLDE